MGHSNRMLIRKDNQILRIIKTDGDKQLIIDCITRSMPKWVNQQELNEYKECTEEELCCATNVSLNDVESLESRSKQEAYNRYSMIAGILPFVGDKKMRSSVISYVANERGVSKQTLRHYLCLYLAYMNKSALASTRDTTERTLTFDERRMRWALNKFFYNQNQHSLSTAYHFMLQYKYTDATGKLFEKYPSFYQFRYFYRKTKNMEKYYISRHGMKDYKSNHRPLLGDGAFSKHIGIGLCDSTVMDIYLINNEGDIVGRPTMSACIDAYSGYCLGFSIGWSSDVEGSILPLILNVIRDKVDFCAEQGITISEEEWECKGVLPQTIVTDMGREYMAERVLHLTDLNIRLLNTNSYSPQEKGKVEKFFDIIQSTYRKYLGGKGIILSDFQKRGAPDYKLQAQLNIKQFTAIITRTVLYYNNERILKDFPFTEQQIVEQVQPHSSAIWKWGQTQLGASLVPVTTKDVVFTMLPRCQGTFTRVGLKANGLRYHCDGYKEEYLRVGKVVVAFNPFDVTSVFLVNKGYEEFRLIPSRYYGKSLDEVQQLKKQQKKLIKENIEDNIQAQIELAEHIQALSETTVKVRPSSAGEIRSTRKRERRLEQKDRLQEVRDHEPNK